MRTVFRITRGPIILGIENVLEIIYYTDNTITINTESLNTKTA